MQSGDHFGIVFYNEGVVAFDFSDQPNDFNYCGNKPGKEDLAKG